MWKIKAEVLILSNIDMRFNKFSKPQNEKIFNKTFYIVLSQEYIFDDQIFF